MLKEEKIDIPILKEEITKKTNIKDDTGKTIYIIENKFQKKSQKKSDLLCFPEFGLTCDLCYNNLFNHPKLNFLKDIYNIYYVDIAFLLPDSISLKYSDPIIEFDELTKGIEFILKHTGSKSFAGMGVGFGTNILLHYGVYHPKKIDHLYLQSAGIISGWMEYFWMSYQNWRLAYRGMTQSTIKFLLEIYFSSDYLQEMKEVKKIYEDHLQKIQPYNLMKIFQGYVKRKDIYSLLKDIDSRVLIFVGSESPYLDDTIEMFSNFNTSTTSWIKVRGCGGLVSEQEPEAMAVPILLFLQGMGLCTQYRTMGSNKIIKV